MSVHSRLLLFVLAFALSGCFQISSLLTVRTDGSATLRDEVTLSGFALLALQEAAEMGDEGTADMFETSMFEDRAAALGEGVRVVSTEVVDDGYVAVYSVPDVSALRYSSPSIPSESDDGDSSGPALDQIELAFAFEQSDPAVLRIVVPKPETDKPTDEPEDVGSESEAEDAVRMIGMMRSFFDDARMTVRVAVEGDVVDTTAEAGAVDGSTVTVFDVPFSAVFDVMEAEPELMDGSDSAVVMDRLAEADGVRFQRPGTVRVRFR